MKTSHERAWKVAAAVLWAATLTAAVVAPLALVVVLTGAAVTATLAVVLGGIVTASPLIWRHGFGVGLERGRAERDEVMS